MDILWDAKAWEQYLEWQNEDKKTLKKINSLLKDIQRNLCVGIGKPEPLVGNLSGWWSRRIDSENRIIYREKNGIVVISSCKGHYEDNRPERK